MAKRTSIRAKPTDAKAAERLTRFDPDYIRQFRSLSVAEQRPIVEAIRAPSLNPAVPAVDRAISAARAKQLQAAMRGKK